VGLIKSLYALNGKDIDSYSLANEAIVFEQKVLLDTVGSQDQIACAVGGINYLEFKSNNQWEITKIVLDSEYIKDIESRIVLIYSGIPRFSSDVSKGLLDKIETKSLLMNRTRELANEFSKILTSKSDLSLVSEMLKESWSIKKELNPLSITQGLENFYQSALGKGAKAGKVLGAGGGGFCMFWVGKEKRQEFLDKFSAGIHVPIRISMDGTTSLTQP
jgi:D-glycero-alpha-D-manno-heptose-7-phosphate kinase